MFGSLGPMELAIILVIVLVIFGAKRVPEIGASFGKGIREFKRSLSDVNNEIRTTETTREADRLTAGTPDRMSTAREETTTAAEPKRLI
jgi:sec-independent protein translocase protein TatA